MTDACTIERGENGGARIRGELTFESVPGLYERAEPFFADGVMFVDLSGVTTVDSAGLALLLEWQASSMGTPGRLEFNNAPPSLLSLASLSEATELLNIKGRDVADG